MSLTGFEMGGIRLSGQEGEDMRDGVQATCKGGTLLLQTWVASVYGVGESGSTLADPNTGPCWSLLLLFSLSEWRLRLILQPSPTSCTINVLPSAAGRRLTVREQLPPPALQPVSLLPRRKPACVVTPRQSSEKLKSNQTWLSDCDIDASHSEY